MYIIFNIFNFFFFNIIHQKTCIIYQILYLKLNLTFNSFPNIKTLKAKPVKIVFLTVNCALFGAFKIYNTSLLYILNHYKKKKKEKRKKQLSKGDPEKYNASTHNNSIGLKWIKWALIYIFGEWISLCTLCKGLIYKLDELRLNWTCSPKVELVWESRVKIELNNYYIEINL